MSDRIIDPRAAALRVGMQREGWATQRDLEQRDEETRRFADAGFDRLIIQETFTSYAYDVPANTTTTMQVLTAFGASNFSLASWGFRTPAQGRLLLIRLSTTGTVAAGTVTPQLHATESFITLTYNFDDCQLSTADPNFNTSRFHWENAVQIAKDASIVFRLVTSSGYSPTTLDFVCQAVIGYEDWASS
jgi:hypothetical protein